MYSPKYQQLGLASSLIGLGLLFLVIACTDQRPKEVFLPEVPTPRPDVVTRVAEVRFQDQDTTAFQMVAKYGSLFLTGRPFGFARWDISSDPENPILMFAASDNIQVFSNSEVFGPWVLDWFGSTALAVEGRYAIMSGIAGTSVIDISETSQPVEVWREPRSTGDDFRSDEAFKYLGIATHPTLPLVYGFRESDFVYYLDVPTLPRLPSPPTARDAYGDQNVCCVRGVTQFGERLFVAMRNRVWTMEMNSDGSLGVPKENATLAALGVVASKRVIYIQHEPNASQGFASFPRGIYAFDLNGRQVGFFPISPITFAVSENDTHFYTFEGDNMINIYKINWAVASAS